MAGVLHSTASAEEAERTPPFIEITVPFEIQNDLNFRSDDGDNETNQLTATIEPEIIFHLPWGFSLNTLFVFEQVKDTPTGEDGYFKNHGAYVQHLFLQWEGDVYESAARKVALTVFGGKISANFGIAWDKTPGVYGTDFAEDYEFTEKIGFGAAVKLVDGALGEHALSFSVFFQDTSVLSKSVFTVRQRTRKVDGGASNTESFNSFAIALDGNAFFGIEGLTYHVAYTQQTNDTGPDLRGVVFGLTTKWTWDKLTVQPIFEVAHFWNAGAVSSQTQYYITAGFGFEYGNWNAAITGTVRNTLVPGGSEIHDNLIQATVGYSFGFGLGVAVGYSFRNEESIGTHTVGVLFTYEFSTKVGGTR